MSSTMQEIVQLTVMSCGQCGITFAAPESWRAEKQRRGDGWFCPNGHSRVYRESDVDKLKRELAAQKARTWEEMERLFSEQRRHEQTQKEMKRLKNRAKAGVCPCCHRTISQMARHMATKHPEFKP